MTKNSNKACFSCFDYMIFQETRDKRQETRDKRQDNPIIFQRHSEYFNIFFTGYFYYFFSGEY